MRDRVKKVCFKFVIIIGIGLAYGKWYAWSGIGIPCLFYQITGKKCPGCGITRMCMALLKLDLKTAFFSNPVIFSMLPLGMVLTLRWMKRYILYEDKRFTQYEEFVLIVIIIVLIGFGILRNINGMIFQVPT